MSAKGCRRLPSVARMRAKEGGAALVIAILVLAILTVIGIALMLVTSTESRIAANEWSINRAFYASDSGVRWASVQMNDPQTFLTRPEFVGPPRNPFGIVHFELPSHRNAGVGSLFFSGDTPGGDIEVKVESPSLLGRRFAPGGRINEGDERAQHIYAYEVRSTGGSKDTETNAFLMYSKALVADVEVGPLPARLPF